MFTLATRTTFLSELKISPLFRSALARFYLAVDAEGMDARRKLNKLAQWFDGSAGEIIAAHVPQQDADTAYPTCLSRLEQLWRECRLDRPLDKAVGTRKSHW